LISIPLMGHFTTGGGKFVGAFVMPFGCQFVHIFRIVGSNDPTCKLIFRNFCYKSHGYWCQECTTM
jgi:hypothetical protein